MRHRRTLLAVGVMATALAAGCADTGPATLAPRGTNRDAASSSIHPRNAAARADQGASRSIASVSASAFMPAIISNTVVALGVHPEAHLNVPGGQLSAGVDPTTYVGVRYFNPGGTAGGSEATAPGCLCEGWGAGDALAGVSGYANVDSDDGARNIEVENFVVTTSTAVSTVLIRRGDGRPWLRVTHDYHPSASTNNLYEATVTIANVSGETVDLRYRRVMDWDIAPNTFDEYVTIQGTSADNVLFASNDGFASADPLGDRPDLGYTGDFVDAGPDDHGALFDFGFGLVAPGQSRTFTIFYGAAANEEAANFALTQVGAEVYSFGQASYEPPPFWTGQPYESSPHGSYGAETGEPHTFIFAFRSVGGDPVFTPLDVTLFIAPAPISLARSDLIYVWLPSSDDFDATRTVHASPTLGNETDPEAPIARQPSGAPFVMHGDFNRDGRPDLAFVFRKADLVSRGDLNTSTNRLVLRASHETEGLIRAEGPVRVVP